MPALDNTETLGNEPCDPLEKPFCQACENNKRPILEVLRTVFADARSVLEIGSGTGQHAAFFAAGLPHLIWQTSDVENQHRGIEAWVREVDNALSPITLDVSDEDWPVERVDAVYAANTAHIMHWPVAANMFKGIAGILSPGGVFTLYGPFNYGGAYTSPGNERFDQSLRSTDPGMGIRDFEAVDALAESVGMKLVADHAMPANNRILVWEKVPILVTRDA